MSWRYVNAAVAGTSHISGGAPCQDDCLVDIVSLSDDDVMIAIASDGAGSAQRAEDGSGIACESFVAAVDSWLRKGGAIEHVTRHDAEQWIANIRLAIESRACETGLTPRDFACTIVAAIVGKQAAGFLQIGDGAIVIGSAGSYEVVFWPDSGEYANMTFFATDDDWPKNLHFELSDKAFNDVALMTDGLQRLALHFETRAAYAPFFAPVFETLRTRESGYAADLEPELLAFLESGPVNDRTDDDKTLILATRDGGAMNGDR